MKNIKFIIVMLILPLLIGCNNNQNSSLEVEESNIKASLESCEENHNLYSGLQLVSDGSVPNSQENLSSYSNTSKTVVSKTTAEANKVDFSDKEIINTAPNITSQQVLNINAGMKYSEVFEILGVGANYCDFKLNVYRVDGERVLVLRSESLEDICPHSGKELLENCVSYPKENPALKEKQLFGIVITDTLTFFPHSESEGGYLSNLEKAEIVNEDGITAKASDITVGSKVLIDYNIILSSSPPKIYCTRVKILK